ncbi:MAG: hypothetical protein HY821_05410 [Acidobacteria bacterium]|nr:hypothetical protein [Acidobacteriota bacterium]
MRTLLLWAVVMGVVCAQEKTAPAGGGLAIGRQVLHQKQEDGPAIPAGYEYYSGELLYLSFRVTGFRAVKDVVDLRWQVVAVDPEGLLLTPPANGVVREELSVNDKDWLPKVQYTLPLPAQLPPGEYKLKIQVADENAKASADKEVAFRVGGRALPKLEKFSVLGLGFYRDDADRQPMEAAVYKVGQTLLAKFQLAGFQLGEKNRFEVSYGLAVLGASGKVLYAQENAAGDDGAPFYPRRLLNGALTLNLTEGVQAATYTLVVKARDKVGQTEAEARAEFQVVK